MHFVAFIAAFLFPVVLASTDAPAARVRIDGDRLTVTAHQTPLRELLAEFAHADVDVRVDPSIDVLVSGSCRNTPMEEALEALLGPYSYVVFWEVVPGPLGDLPRLTEIQVFKPDQRSAVVPLQTDDGRLRVTRGPAGGPLFVQDELLVTVRAGVTAEAFRTLLAQIGGTVVGSVPALGVYRIRLPAGTNIPDLVAQLQRNELLRKVEPNYAMELPTASGVAGSVASASAPEAPVGAPRLAVLDSGLLGGSGAEAAVVGRYDALDPSRTLSDPAGHGTQMALVAAGSVQPEGAYGDETGVPLLAIRAFDEQGLTSSFALARAITYALDQGARVLNLSWGSDTDSAFIANAVAYAQSRGAIVVASAGNAPTGNAVYPAAYNGVVAVAALDSSGSPWSQSNHGSFVDLAAPGTAGMPVGYQGAAGTYAGTSIASAYVSRELALYLARHPTATAAQALQALQSALSQGADGYGAGSLDAAAAARLRSE